MAIKIISSRIQKWGNSLAVRIPATLARGVDAEAGTEVNIEMHKGSLIITPTSDQKLSLQDRLDLFDAEKHGGEVMASGRVGVEKF